MLDLASLLGPDLYPRLMRGVARGRYQVLLGAGASATSKDRWGKNLPSGFTLRNEIAEEFGLSDAGDKSLKRVYQLASRKRSKTNDTMAEYLQERFTNTQPDAWYRDLLQMQWSGLWTLNIDDCVERSFTALGKNARQRVVSISWSDRHRQADLRKDELLLVHLHGKASRSSRENELIFDVSTYLNALTAQHRWLKIFGDEFPAKPFIVVGASFDEEIDLQAIIEEGRPAGDHPSLIVLRDIDEFQFDEYVSYGLTPVRSTAEDFFAAIRAALPEFLNELAPDEQQELSSAPAEAIRFLTQWRRLSTRNPPKPDLRHDLYQGHQPRWSDALSDLISPRDCIPRVAGYLTAVRKPAEHSTALLTGEAFSGKSAILFRAARLLLQEGFQPYLFRAEEAFDREAIKYWLRRYPKSVLLVDDASDFAYDVADLLDELKDSDISLRLLLVERSSRAGHLGYQLSAFDYREFSVPDRLAAPEVTQLIALLERRRRLGVLTNLNPRERNAYFVERDRKLFSSMAELEGGRGFQQRVTDEFDRATTDAGRRLLAVVGLASRVGYGLPLDIVKTAVGLTAVEVDVLVGGDLGDLLVAENATVHARHRIFGELLFRYLDREERSDAVVRLAVAVAPHVSPVAISLATVYYRIVRALMGRVLLLEVLDNDRAAALGVFEELEPAYAWNARFWEQRSLIASEAGHYEKAFSWAQQGVSRKRDEKSLTTLGVVLMQRALAEANSGAWPTDSFEKAEAFLAEARLLEGNRAEFPFDTFFHYTIRIMRRVPDRDAALNMQIASLWQNWFAAILALDESSQARLARLRGEVIEAWEEFQLGRVD